MSLDDEFLAAFSLHTDRLHNLARGLTASAADAEDLLSETCLLALRGWRRRPPDDPGAWFATVCLNAARSRARRTSARPVEVGADGWLDAVHDPAPGPADRALVAVEVDRLRVALAGLPAAQREAITLMDLAGFTAAEVARMQNCPRGTVLARVHRGRKVLAAVLTQPATAREVGDAGQC